MVAYVRTKRILAESYNIKVNIFVFISDQSNVPRASSRWAASATKYVIRLEH